MLVIISNLILYFPFVGKNVSLTDYQNYFDVCLYLFLTPFFKIVTSIKQRNGKVWFTSRKFQFSYYNVSLKKT